MAAANERPASTAIELTLELDTKGEPIAGSLQGPDGTSYPFVGWLAFTALLETLRRDAPTAASRQGHAMDQRFTQAESGVVALVCDGLTNGEIAQRLNVSPRTVQRHLLTVFRKLDASTRAELVARMLRAWSETEPPGAQGTAAATGAFTAMWGRLET